MARQTLYIVQTFRLGRRNAMTVDAPVSCQSAAAARRSATRLAQSRRGVIAFASSGDVETGDYHEEPIVLFKAGRLPEAFDALAESPPEASDDGQAQVGGLYPRPPRAK